MRYLITISICTNSREEYLYKALSSVIKQLESCHKKNVEILVLESGICKSDLVKKLVKENQDHEIRYELVKVSGIAESRNVALKKARSRYVAFIDDDVILASSWLVNLLKYIKNNPDTSIFGGPALALLEPGNARPAWLPSEFNNLDLGDSIKEINYTSEWLIAANLTVKREIVAGIGGFNSELGMTTRKLGYGEETELMIRLKKFGHASMYVPNIRVMHIVRKDKLKISWHIRSLFSLGSSLAKTLNQNNDIKFILRYYGKSPIRAIYCLINTKIYKYPTNIYYFLVNIVPMIGATYSYLGNILRFK